MKYASTRAQAPAVSLAAAIASGPAPDGGLYVPEAVPRLDFDALDPAMPLAGFAAAMLAPYFDGDPLAAALPAIAAESLDFEAPLREDAPGEFVLELFHGPTAAFKDYGARFLAQCVQRLDPGAPRTVLVATSGDTGSAVAAAFHRLPGFRVVVLYPDGRVSARQAHQLGAFGDNVTALRVDGSFDDCQRLARQAFADDALRSRAPLLSANSISLGRLLPQATWFAQAALRHARAHAERLSFAIPSGNLGHATACLLARAMGAPIARIALATNANRWVEDWLEHGEARPRASIATLANAMDVGDPSNAERLRAMFPAPADRARAFIADSVDDAAIRGRIEASAAAGRIACPHTACALELVARRRAHGDAAPWCAVATAHPAKFETVVEPIIGRAVPVPP
ncbi:MAG TPA: threonine synthase, partial [Xanthomonadales bacterium]|nr:threonine synthase [Xanthomonadales bacterium]